MSSERAELKIVRGADLPVQIHHGTRPAPAFLQSLHDDDFVRFAAHPKCGFWTSSLNPATGTTEFHPMHKLGDDQPCDLGVEDWRVTPRADVRVLVLETPADYETLLGYHVHGNPGLPVAEQVGGRFFPTWKIKWDNLLLCCDALRIMPPVVAALRRYSRSALLYRECESTYWFQWCFTDVTTVQLAAYRLADAPNLVHPEDQDSSTNGLPLPDGFHPEFAHGTELAHGTLTIPITASLDDVGLVVALHRLSQWVVGMLGSWLETTDDVFRGIAWRALRLVGVVLIEDRRAVGLAITTLHTRWGVSDGKDPACAIFERDWAVPSLDLLFVCADTPDRWQARATRLVHAAAKANAVAPHELAFRGPFNDELWAFYRGFANKDGWLLITTV